jgi:hypothetical protein
MDAVMRCRISQQTFDERRDAMSDKKGQDGRRIRVRAVRRDPPDLRKLSRALIALALEQAQAEADAQAAHEKEAKTKEPPRAA